MGLSERRACSFAGADRKMIRYQSCRPPEKELRHALRDLANERRRFGYRRRVHPAQARGRAIRHNRILSLLPEEGLTVSQAPGAATSLVTRAPSWSRRTECTLVTWTSARPFRLQAARSAVLTSSMTVTRNRLTQSLTRRFTRRRSLAS